jgi:outer membrane receptor protein involved in Fe transport
VAWSALQQDREETFLSEELIPLGNTYNAIYEQKLSTMLMAEPWVHARFRVTFGASAMERSVDNLFAQRTSGWLLRPFASMRWDIMDQVQIDAGAAFSHFSFNGDELFEPRVGLRWQPGAGHVLSASYGVRGQLPQHQLLNMHGFPSLPNNAALGLTRSEDLMVGYAFAVDQRLTVRAEAYRQRLSNVPVLAPGLNLGMPESMGTVNIWDEPLLLPQAPTGDGQNSGVELSVDRSFEQGWFALVNGTVYSSTFTDASGTERVSRWDSQWMGNAMGGKEWRREKDDRVRTWGVSMRIFAMGGLRHTPLDVRIREGFAWPVPAGPAWSAQFEDLFRSDLRIYRKMDRKGRTAMWALDLQNVTNTRNAAFIYFDRRKGEVVTKYQLGLIPNLSYRVEFKTKTK